MSALPCPAPALAPSRQTDAAGRLDAAGRPDIGYTAARCPVMVFNFEPWASLYLVTVTHAGERRRTWVYGNPARLVEFARGLRLEVSAEAWPDIDPTLKPVEEGEPCAS